MVVNDIVTTLKGLIDISIIWIMIYAIIKNNLMSKIIEINNIILEINGNDNKINNVVVIPSIEGIVFGGNNKYGVVNSTGKVIIPFKNDKIFSATNEGIDEYFLERSGVVVSLERYLETNNIKINNNNKHNISQTPSNMIDITDRNTSSNATNNSLIIP